VIPPSRSTRGQVAAGHGPVGEHESSVGSPSFENSDYDTPGTSISTTPAVPIRSNTKPSRKSHLGAVIRPSLGNLSSRKRTHAEIADTDDELDAIDVDAELAMQMQLEEEQSSKGRNDDTNDAVSSNEWLPRKRRALPYKGKGKGKATEAEIEDSRVDDWMRRADDPVLPEDLLSSSEDLSDYLSDEDSDKMPTQSSSKGKGKGRVARKLSSKHQPIRSRGKGKTKSIADANSDLDHLEDDDDFELDEDDLEMLSHSKNEALSVDGGSSDDESLHQTINKTRTPKVGKGKKKTLTAAEKRERALRLARFNHIQDKWERKRAMNRERAEQSHPKLLTMWNDLKKVPVLEVQRAEQPASINRRLKPFQLEGLSWMTRQEKTAYKGGLLGDEMGMGKTIQAVSLIMSDWPQKEPTLVVVPPVALMQWSNEIGEYTNGKLKVLIYHGTNAKCKKMTVKDLRKFDVIMVSYNSLESLHRKETKGWTRGDEIIKEASPLHAIKYHRLILDEAHSIKSRTTGVAKACFALKGTYKWCLSGTPVQNRIGEFFSLLRFLEVRPFADYFCRSCSCEQLHW